MKTPFLRARQTGQTILPRAKRAILTILSGPKRPIQTILSGANRIILPAILAALWLGASSPALSPATTQTAAQPLPSSVSKDWWPSVQKSIRDSEYDVTPSAGNRQNSESKAPATVPEAVWQAPNRAQNLRTYFTEKGPRVVRRTETEPSWVWGLELVGFGVADCALRIGNPVIDASVSPALRKASEPCPPVVETKREGNRIEFRRQGGLVEWYVNDPKGLEQGFTVPESAIPNPESSIPNPKSSIRNPQSPIRNPQSAILNPQSPIPNPQSEIVLDLAVRGNLRPSMAPDGKTIEFLTDGGVGLIHYGGLKAVDAAGRDLPARMELVSLTEPNTAQVASLNPQSAVRLVVDASNAQYPITIDPLATSAAWTAESDQAGANFGQSVSAAGDVNGDGYGDVIVGAPLYDGGQTNEGAVFVYHGSASGLATVPAWSAVGNQAGAGMGYHATTAGDVNGDGYSDVIVGASYHSNGQTNEGRAYVYHGSASGLATSPNWTVESDQAGARFGWHVSTAGDVNGDGYSDVIVGAFAYDNGQTDEGRAFVYHGSATGLSSTPAWTAESDQAGAYFGWSVSPADDVNGDGYADVIVGVRYYDNGQTDEGRAYVYHGSALGLSATPNWTSESDQAYAEFGVVVSGAGDVNGDGYSDVIVGAWYYDNGQTDEGRVFVYHGSATGLSSAPSWTAESDQASGSMAAVSTAGDVNGDGYADVIVGSWRYDNGQTDEGRAYLYLGSASGLWATPAWMAEGDQAYAEFGLAVSGAGDVNGDGYSDVVVGAHGYDNGQTDEGKVWLYYGSPSNLSTTAGWTAESDQAGAQFGWSVSTAGDVNGDGYGDVLVGAPYYDNGETDEGMVFVYHGSASGLSAAAWTAESNQASACFGFSASAAGDVNGDGYDDVIIGALYYDNGEVDEGRAFVWYGSAAGLGANGTPGNADWTAESDQANAYFGKSVSTAGDVNGDGYSDIIVGAYCYDNSQTDEGRAYVYLGSSSGLSSTPAWVAENNSAGSWFGASVSTAGDVNGDGFSDVIVGAWRFSNPETYEGRVYVYHGSESGLSSTPNWSVESNHALAWFGWPVACAGDVNGDGYSDVLVGASGYDNPETDEGRVFLYLGSSTGLPPTFSWSAESNQANAEFGWAASTAGDVNGDGYADVIAGAHYYDDGQSDEGNAFLYLGGPTGPASTPIWIGQCDQAVAWFGHAVACAGDVNGDGYSDVIVGAPYYDNGQTDEGKVWLYYGNGEAGRGLSLRPRQLRSDGSAPIAHLGKSDSVSAFQVAALARTPYGRGKVKLEVEAKPLGTAFNGAGTTVSPSWVDAATPTTELSKLVSGLSGNTPYHWRARLLYHAVTTPLQQRSRWFTIPCNGWQEADFRLPSGSPPRIESVIYNDLDDDGAVETSETLTLVMSRAVTINAGQLTQSDFYLCVQGDSLGGAGFSVALSPENARHIVLTLGANPVLTLAGTANPSVTAPGSPSGLDFSTTLAAGDVRAAEDFMPAEAGGQPGVDDSAVDILFTCVTKTTAITASAGGTATVTNSPDAAYTHHSLAIPAGALTQNVSVTMRPPQVNLGVLNAVQIDVVAAGGGGAGEGRTGVSPAMPRTPSVSSVTSVVKSPRGMRTLSDPPLSQPVTLTLEYKDSDYDTAAGDVEASMRIHQLVLNPSSAYEWMPVPGTRQNRPDNNTVSVQLDSLNPCGSIGEIRVFAVLPGWTIEPIKAHIRPKPGSTAIIPTPAPPGKKKGGLGRLVEITPGASGDYTLHRLEIPNYETTTDTDPDRVTLTLTQPTLLQRAGGGGCSFPSGSSALFLVTAKNADDNPVAFTAPTNIRVQFMDGTQSAYNDLRTFDGTRHSRNYLRLVWDALDGPCADFQFVDRPVTIAPAPGGGTVEAQSVPNLTGASGEGVWGVVPDPPKPASVPPDVWRRYGGGPSRWVFRGR